MNNIVIKDCCSATLTAKPSEVTYLENEAGNISSGIIENAKSRLTFRLRKGAFGWTSDSSGYFVIAGDALGLMQSSGETKNIHRPSQSNMVIPLIGIEKGPYTGVQASLFVDLFCKNETQCIDQSGLSQTLNIDHDIWARDYDLSPRLAWPKSRE